MKDHRDLDRLNLDAKEVIFTALKFDIQNYIKQEFYNNILPLVQKTNDQQAKLKETETAFQKIRRDYEENKHNFNMKFSKMVLIDDFRKQLSYYDQKLQMEVTMMQNDVIKVVKGIDKCETNQEL